METNELFEKIWAQYISLNPQAKKIHALLKIRGDQVLNDHVAYRSFQIKDMGIDALKAPFVSRGYEAKGEYHFEKKKLFAIHLEHENRELPKVFISELLVNELSESARMIVRRIVDQFKTDPVEGDDLLTLGRPWNMSHSEYNELYKESEYAGWLSAFGYCANHFTVNVNNLQSFQELSELNSFLQEEGFKLNESGGVIKGSSDVFLEQSSTMAAKLNVDFSDGAFEIPSCYYEFAKRYPLESGDLYQGFVTGSADKIFESTNQYS